MTASDQVTVFHAIDTAANAVGANVYAHAIDVDSGREVGVRADDPVVSASTFKVPVLTEYVRQVAAGELDQSARIRIDAGSATIGPTGLSVLVDDAEWSLRDVATSMITVSDNAATDIVMRLVGIDRVNATMTALGLPATVVVDDCAAILASFVAEFGGDTDDPDDLDVAAEPERVAQLSACQPARTNRTTPREATRLLQLLWTDQAASPDACAEARRILGLQVWPHRLASGFPHDDDIVISGKTGTIGVVRNEIGVAEFPEGRRYAVAVFLRTHRSAFRQPAADALIGTVGRLLVEQLATT
jgi:beta-lactamase class A